MLYISWQVRAVNFVMQKSQQFINSSLERASFNLIIDFHPRRDERYFWIANNLSFRTHKLNWNPESQTKDRVKAGFLLLIRPVC